eukprot:COSAG05_NODE_1121_length_5808_cov_2.774391_5_plen_46_part_00
MYLSLRPVLAAESDEGEGFPTAGGKLLPGALEMVRRTRTSRRKRR